ncbi:hypothetical protein OG394_33690 [Kribbella sp. NBC_01245]|uniref:hypothetical protein n=1 Tax=Kribbella sp. NBC_01245 TaxID=2903578 RepID=UPI002E2AECC0|nr:hypothetical protein [Kribbella sp. NBC_01245]
MAIMLVAIPGVGAAVGTAPAAAEMAPALLTDCSAFRYLTTAGEPYVQGGCKGGSGLMRVKAFCSSKTADHTFDKWVYGAWVGRTTVSKAYCGSAGFQIKSNAYGYELR